MNCGMFTQLEDTHTQKKEGFNPYEISPTCESCEMRFGRSEKGPSTLFLVCCVVVVVVVVVVNCFSLFFLDLVVLCSCACVCMCVSECILFLNGKEVASVASCEGRRSCIVC
jgi:hypothetical protein